MPFMGIGLNQAEICILEHRRRPLGRVLLFGRQTMFFTPKQAVDLLRHYGVTPIGPAGEIDRVTTAASGSGIRDDEFFRLLGVPKITVMDKSAYEGADIIHDLNKPIPFWRARSVDFILDGSTLDNVWNPAMAIQNMARLLRPGGRIVSVNMASNHNGPYTVMSPTWVLDYFVVNRFVDCRVAVTVLREDGAFSTYSLDLDALGRDAMAYNFQSKSQMGLQFVAEKGPDSTWDRTPSQQQYRSAREWDEYEKNLAAMRRSKRNVWGSSAGPISDATAGYRYEPGGHPT